MCGVAHDVGPSLEVQLLHCPRLGALHRLDAERELLGNFLVSLVLDDLAHHPPPALGEVLAFYLASQR